MICSSMHCYNEAKPEIITVNGQWWKPILNPAPFCDECKKKNAKTAA